MKASLALLSLLTAFTSHSLKSPAVPPTVVQIQANTNLAIADGARQQIGSTLFYDPAYMQLTYPGGDVPQERGVCSDVVIRALRSQKVDLQKLVHEDMAKNFAEYPQKWQLKRPDSNIDHRRVPNLETWFSRHDKTRPTSKNPSDYQAGDIVSWRLDNGLAHIGVVSDGFARDGTPLVIHNIGAGAQEGRNRAFAILLTQRAEVILIGEKIEIQRHVTIVTGGVELDISHVGGTGFFLRLEIIDRGEEIKIVVHPVD